MVVEDNNQMLFVIDGLSGNFRERNKFQPSNSQCKYNNYRLKNKKIVTLVQLVFAAVKTG